MKRLSARRRRASPPASPRDCSLGWPGGHPALSSSSEPMLANPAGEKTPPSSRLRRKLGGFSSEVFFFKVISSDVNVVAIACTELVQ